ncbi:MAG: hypothetical protein LBU91_07715 [Bacteroidales bacterium]|jgi:hypothetical protein|nr:hypothetical protein [Bacteroidales bacterium]
MESGHQLLKIKPKKVVSKKKKKPRKVKYNLTLSDTENTLLAKVCKKDETTPTRLIKSVLKSYLIDRSTKINDEIAENQLNLFKNPKPVQYKIDD